MSGQTPHIANGLRWLRIELENSLSRARAHLEFYLENVAERAPLVEASEELRVVRGTLSMVRCAGAATLAEEMYQLLREVLDDRVEDAHSALATLFSATLHLSDYLDLLTRGEQDRAVVLQPWINELRLIGGKPIRSESDLFGAQARALDLIPTVRPRVLPYGSAQDTARRELTAFQTQLLRWLKGVDPVESLGSIGRIADELAAACKQPAVQRFWGCLAVLAECMTGAPEPDSLDLKRLFGRGGMNVKAIAEQGEAAAAAQIGDAAYQALYFIARTSTPSARALALRESLDLATLAPTPQQLEEVHRRLAGPNTAALTRVNRELREDFQQIKDGIDLAVRTAGRDATGQRGTWERLQRLSAALRVLGLPGPAQALSNLSARLSAGSQDMNLWLEAATTILAIEHGLDEGLFRVGHTSEAPAPTSLGFAGPGPRAPHVADVREATEALVAQSLINCARLKSAVDGFLATGQEAPLGDAPVLFAEIAAGMDVLQQHRASGMIRQLQGYAERGVLKTLKAEPQEAARFADAVSSLEIFLETLRDGELHCHLDDLGHYLTALLPGPLAETPVSASAADSAVLDVEAGAAGAVADAAEEAAVAQTAPQDEAVTPLQTEPVSEAVPAGEDAPAEDAPAETSAQTPPPVAQDVAPAPASAPAPAAPVIEEVDEEIREVFLEEAAEVLGELQRTLPNLRRDAQDREALVTVRRAFHTLKGSGRMVGATGIGDYAWSIEHLLNRCLDGSLPLTAPILDALEQAVALLPALIEAFRERRPHVAEVDTLIEHAQALLNAPPAPPPAPALGLQETFQADLRERAHSIEQWLAQVTAEPKPVEATTELMRAFHTIRGSAAIVQLDAVAQLANGFEGYVNTALQSQRRLPAAAVALVREGLATIREWSVPGADLPRDVAGWLERLDVARAALATPAEEPAAAPMVASGHHDVCLFALDELDRFENSFREWQGHAQDLAPAADWQDALYAFAAKFETAGGEPLKSAGAALAEQLGRPLQPSPAFFASVADIVEMLRQGLDGYREAGRAGDAAGVLDRIAGLPVARLQEPVLEDGAHNRGEMPAVAAPPTDEAPVDVVVGVPPAAPDPEDTTSAPSTRPAPDATPASETTLTPESDADPGQFPVAAPEVLSPDPAAPEALQPGAEAADGSGATAGHEAVAPLEPALPEVPAAETTGAPEAAPLETHASGSAPQPPAVAESELPPPEAGVVAAPAHGPIAEEARATEHPELEPLQHATVTAEPLALDVAEELTDAAAGSSAPAEMDELGQIFLEEASELLAQFDEQLAMMAQSSDAAVPASLRQLLQTMHGSALMAGFHAWGAHVQRLERTVGDSDAAATPGLAQVRDALFEGAHQLRSELLELQRFGRPADDLAPPDFTPPDAPVAAKPVVMATPTPTPTPAPEPGAPAYQPAPTVPLVTEMAPDHAGWEGQDRELVEIFVAESAGLLESLEASIEAWLDHNEDSDLRETLRLLHSVKGAARIAGQTAMGEEAHQLETCLAEIQEAPDSLDPDMQRAVRDSIGRLIAFHEQLAATDPAVVRGGAGKPLRDAAAQSAADGTAWSSHLTWTPPADAQALTGARREAVRVPVEVLDTALNNAGEISITRSRLEQHAAVLRQQLAEVHETIGRVREHLRMLDIETEAQIAARGRVGSAPTPDPYAKDFDPLEMDRYSRMQELSRALAESVNDVALLHQSMIDSVGESEGLLLQQSRVNTDMQQRLMDTLMVPFSRQVPKLVRLVRQTAQENGRQAQIYFEGASSELDRHVLDRMGTALEHILRNAIVHGLETPEERIREGKSPTGRIDVILTRDNAQLVIQVRDDGRGLNFEAIRRKATERGLMRADAKLSDDDVAGFIFEPGFSTAAALTRDAGRGVGLDVVSSEVKQLGGTIELRRKRARGTTFLIRLPVSLALSNVLLVDVQSETYAMPLASVVGIVRVPRSEIEALQRTPDASYVYAERSYRFAYLADLVSAPRVEIGAARTVPLVLIGSGEGLAERHFAVAVDRLLGNRQIVSKAVGPQVTSVTGISGATILPDGRVVLILDVAALAAERSRREAIGRPVSAELTREDVRPAVMVVDDSVTVRRVTERLLTRNGYRVITAKDGLDALALLQKERPGAILLDIEMPRADGFEVAASIRHTERIADVPIIMITSRSSEKHRARALSLGVNRYLIKPYQEEQLLQELTEVGMPA